MLRLVSARHKLCIQGNAVLRQSERAHDPSEEVLHTLHCNHNHLQCRIVIGKGQLQQVSSIPLLCNGGPQNLRQIAS